VARTLLVVDVQQGFLNDFTRHIPGRVASIIQEGVHDEVLFTCFVNTPGSPYRRLLGWEACEGPPDTLLAPELEQFAQPELVFRKEGMAGIPDALRERLRDSKTECVDLVGIDTDMCVLKCAMDLFDLGIEPVVLVDACASTAGLQAHLAGLAILGRNIGARQLRLVGRDEGFLAAP